MLENYYYEPISSEILCQHKVTTGCQTFPYHRHNGYEIFLFIQGNINYYIEHNCYQLTTGDLFITPPSEMHRVVSLDDNLYERITLNIKRPVLDRLSTPKTDLSACFYTTNLGQNIFVRLENEDLKKFINLANDLSRVLESDNYGSDILINVYLSQLLLLVNSYYRQSSFSQQSIMPPLIKNVMLYIEQNLTTDISLEKLTNKFYHDGTYISRQFKHHTGLTLREYILDRRIEEAKRLLSNGENVSEACCESGFSNYSNFIRSFTKLVGISPGKYMRLSKTM